jgi:hypothetical protein
MWIATNSGGLVQIQKPRESLTAAFWADFPPESADQFCLSGLAFRYIHHCFWTISNQGLFGSGNERIIAAPPAVNCICFLISLSASSTPDRQHAEQKSMSRLSMGRLITVLITCVLLAQSDQLIAIAQTGDQPTDKAPLRQGDSVGVFYVTKIAGAANDGVEPGEQLCYRCRYGSSPIVMIFARRTGGRVTELVKRIDKAVFSNRRRRLKGLVTMMGENSSDVIKAAGEMAAAAGVTHVPVVVAKELQTGPLNYKLPADAEVTVVVAKDSQVVKTHTFTSEKVDIAAIMNEVERILK